MHEVLEFRLQLRFFFAAKTLERVENVFVGVERKNSQVLPTVLLMEWFWPSFFLEFEIVPPLWSYLVARKMVFFVVFTAGFPLETLKSKNFQTW